MIGSVCPICHGKRLKREALSVTFAGLDIAEMSQLPLSELGRALDAGRAGAATAEQVAARRGASGEAHRGTAHRAATCVARIERAAATSASAICRSSAARRRSRPANCSACGSRRRCARISSASSTCSTSRPRGCTRPTPRRCSRALDQLKAAGNSLFVVEHDLDVIRHADWIVDVGPGAGEHGGRVLYSGPPERALRESEDSQTRAICSATRRRSRTRRARRAGWLRLRGRHAQQSARLDVAFPLGVLHRGDRRLGLRQVEPGEPGARRAMVASSSGTSRVPRRRGRRRIGARRSSRRSADASQPGWTRHQAAGHHRSEADRPHAALESRDVHGPVRRRPQAASPTTPAARRRGATTPGASRSTSPRAAARPARARASSWSSCCSCRASMRPARPATARATTRRRSKIAYRGKTIADVLGMTVDAAWSSSPTTPAVAPLARRCCATSASGYLRLGQPATELSGGEAQRIKLATELQRSTARRHALRPRRADHRPAPGRRRQADGAARRPWSRPGNTVIVVEHDMRVAAASDWVIDIGPGAGDEGGRIVAPAPPPRWLPRTADGPRPTSLNGWPARRKARARSPARGPEQPAKGATSRSR